MNLAGSRFVCRIKFGHRSCFFDVKLREPCLVTNTLFWLISCSRYLVHLRWFWVYFCTIYLCYKEPSCFVPQSWKKLARKIELKGLAFLTEKDIGRVLCLTRKNYILCYYYYHKAEKAKWIELCIILGFLLFGHLRQTEPWARFLDGAAHIQVVFVIFSSLSLHFIQIILAYWISWSLSF